MPEPRNPDRASDHQPAPSTERDRPGHEDRDKEWSPAQQQGDAARPDQDDHDDDDGPLDSLGKAVSAPVRDAADPDADEKPE